MLQNGAQQSCRSPRRKLNRGSSVKQEKPKNNFLEVLRMAEHIFGNLIYTYDAAAGEALGKRESHTPKIDAPAKVKPDEAFDLRVTVGPHPNTVEHSIRWIMVTLEEEGRAFNPVVLAKVSLTPVTSQPEVVIKVKLQKGGVLHAVEYCNLHGLWAGKKEITVQ